MKRNKKKKLSLHILVYFIIFSISLLAFLYIIQILCLNTFYKISRTKSLSKAVIELESIYNDKDFKDKANEISLNEEVCIELIVHNIPIYSSSSTNKKCLTRNKGLRQFQNDMISDDMDKSRAEVINPNFNNKTLVIGKKLQEGTFLFVNTSLEPLDNSIKMLKGQFFYIACVIVFVTTIISYFISKRISTPIIKINDKAKKLGSKDYNINFIEDSNILEIDELEKTLDKTTKELAKTDELRRDLVANVSHDLKTPLTLIRAYAEAARDLDYNKKDKREKDLNVIVEETERLTLLVNDILELSKIESNIDEITKEEFNIKDLIYSIIDRFAIMKNDGYNFIINCDDIIVNTDKNKIQRVIYNLVSNAINYSGEDKLVTINIVKKNNNVRVEVIDTGKGIDNKDIDLIWDKYYKVDKNHKRNKSGTGLGLAIVKSILTSLNYKYGVISKKGIGTTFYFEIK